MRPRPRAEVFGLWPSQASVVLGEAGISTGFARIELRWLTVTLDPGLPHHVTHRRLMPSRHRLNRHDAGIKHNLGLLRGRNASLGINLEHGDIARPLTTYE